MTDPQRQQRNIGGLVCGMILMLLGTMLFLDRLGLVDGFDVVFFWPVAFIAIGLGKLSYRHADGRREGGWWVVLGVALLLNQMHLLRMRDAWPLLLIAFGISIVWKELVRRPRMHERVE